MAGLTLKQFRDKYPEYNDIPDTDLADRLYRKYPDVPKDQFYRDLGLSASGKPPLPSSVNNGNDTGFDPKAVETFAPKIGAGKPSLSVPAAPPVASPPSPLAAPPSMRGPGALSMPGMDALPMRGPDPSDPTPLAPMTSPRPPSVVDRLMTAMAGKTGSPAQPPMPPVADDSTGLLHGLRRDSMPDRALHGFLPQPPEQIVDQNIYGAPVLNRPGPPRSPSPLGVKGTNSAGTPEIVPSAKPPAADQMTEEFLRSLGIATGPLDQPVVPPKAAPLPSHTGASVSMAPKAPYDQSAANLAKHVATGLTDMFASVPESLALAAEGGKRSRAKGAGQAVDQWTQRIADMQARLADPGLAKDERAIIERNMADLQVGRAVLETEAKADVAPAETTKIYKAGEKFREAVRNTVGAPDPNDNSFLGMLAHGFGSMLGFAIPTAIGSLINPGVGLALGAGLGASGTSSQMYRDAIASGADPEIARKAAGLGALIGTTEVVPVGVAFRLLPPALRAEAGGVFWQALVRAFEGGGEEAVQEFSSQVMQNLTVQKLYDPSVGWSDGASQGAIIGAILGAGLGGAGAVIAPDLPAVAGPVKPTPDTEPAPPDQPPEAGLPPLPLTNPLLPPLPLTNPLLPPLPLTPDQRVPPIAPAQPVAPEPPPPGGHPAPAAPAADRPTPPKTGDGVESGVRDVAFNPDQWKEIAGEIDGKPTGRIWMENPGTGEVISRDEFDKRRAAAQKDTANAPTVDKAPSENRPAVEDGGQAVAPPVQQPAESGDSGQPSAPGVAEAAAPDVGTLDNALKPETQTPSAAAPPAPATPATSATKPDNVATESPGSPSPADHGSTWNDQSEDWRAAILRKIEPTASKRVIGRYSGTSWDGLSDSLREKIAAEIDSGPPAAPDIAPVTDVGGGTAHGQSADLTMGEAGNRWGKMTAAERVALMMRGNPKGDQSVFSRIAAKEWLDINPSIRAGLTNVMAGKSADGKRDLPSQSEAQSAAAPGVTETTKPDATPVNPSETDLGGSDVAAEPQEVPAPTAPETSQKPAQAPEKEPAPVEETAPESNGSEPENTATDQAPAQAENVRLANRLLRMLRSDTFPATNAELMKVAAEEYGGTIAEGTFSPKDAYDAMELAVNMYLSTGSASEVYDPTKPSVSGAVALVEELQALVNKLPTQTRRDAETDAFQQFSTPPAYGFAVNWVANINGSDRVLEPSAGNGGIAVFAKNAGADVDVNELAKRRQPSLEALDFDRISFENAEQIANIWASDPTRRYDTIVMNPPFSASGSRGTKKTSATGAQHIEQALKLLKPGGRLVAIMGHTFEPGNSRVTPFFERIRAGFTLRANVVVVGDQVYKKYGTTYDSRLLVFDQGKTPEGATVIGGRVEDIPALITALEGVRNGRKRDPSHEADAGAGQVAGGKAGARPAGNGGQSGAGKPERPSEPDDLGGTGNGGPRDGKPSGGAGGIAGPESSPDKTAGGKRPTEGDGRPGAHGSRTEPSEDSAGQRGRADSRLTEAPESQMQDAGGGYAKYRPQRIRVEGAKPHPMELVESSAMASVTPPNPNYEMKIPARMVKEGLISEAQLEQVIYAGAAHSEMLDAYGDVPARRKGYYIGDGCVSGDTLIYNPIDGTHTAIRDLAERGKPHPVQSLTYAGLMPFMARAPFRKGVAPLFEVTTESGRKIRVTDGHRFLTPAGWRPLSSGLRVGTLLASSPSLPPSSSALSRPTHDEDGRRLIGTPEDCLRRCSPDLYPDDGQPLLAEGNDREPAPSQAGARAYSRDYSRSDDPETSPEHSHQRPESDPRSRNSSSPSVTRARERISSQAPASGALSSPLRHQTQPQVVELSGGHREASLGDPGQSGSSAACSLLPAGLASDLLPSLQYGGWDRIVSIEFVDVADFYDMYVPGTLNYVAEGLIHHNTGVGKTAEIAAIIADNFAQGRKRSILVSKDKKLLTGAKREFDRLGIKNVPIADFGKVPPGGSISQDASGVLFSTYTVLSRAGKEEKVSRLDQIVNWVGPDFDGVIVFDEAHLAGNALPVRGKRGITKPSATALAVVDLQRRLPNARVVYASATAATEVQNLAYADRLGLWGVGTPFANALDFVNQIVKGGIAAMEVVARDMKQMGVYMARSLSFDGVEYEKVTHTLTAPQRQMYDDAAVGWQGVLENVHKVIEEETKGGGRQRAAAMAAFWSAHQRFFSQVLTSMQMPTIISAIKADLKAGLSPVVQIVNTNEAATNKALSNMEDGDTLEDIDITPREGLMQYIQTSFPVAQYEEQVDSEGNVRTVPSVDADGNFIHNAEAVRIRDELLDRLGSMKLPGSPLDMLIETFGADKVAEVTGRSARIITKAGKKVQERRSQPKTMAEAAEFQDGRRDVLVFSDAGGTGMDFHADLSRKNQKRRAHYVLQAGWRADRAIQGFGRTHRTNQAQPPVYKLAGTDLSGHKRFTSSIARRLDQLGALTKGQKDASGSQMFDATDNLENPFAEAAVTAMITDIFRGNVDGWTMADIKKELGLQLEGETGLITSKIPGVTQFLNRLLNVTIDRQNDLFEKFVSYMEAHVQHAIDNGEFTAGVEELKHDGAVLSESKEAFRDAKTGATSQYQMVTIKKKIVPMSFNGLVGAYAAGSVTFKKHGETGIVYGFRPAASRTAESGEVIPTYHRYSVTDRNIVDSTEYRVRYEAVKADDARTAWDQQFADAPKEREESVHLVTGTLLPIWDRLPASSPRIVRMKLDNGQQLLGRVIPSEQLTETLDRLGVDAPKIDMTPTQIQEAVMSGKTVLLSSGHQLVRRRVGGEMRIEVIPDHRTFYGDTQMNGTLARMGFLMERIGFKNRIFAATGTSGTEAIGNLMKGKSIANVITSKDQSGWHGSPADFDRFSLDHIGTGEGAQVYGWGLYFASRRSVAEHYRDKLSNKTAAHFTMDGKRLSPAQIDNLSMLSGGMSNAVQIFLGGSGTRNAIKRGNDGQFRGLVRSAVERHTEAAEVYADRIKDRESSVVASATLSVDDLRKRMAWEKQQAREIQEFSDSLTFVPEATKGRLFKVEIPEDSEMLDWDKPLSEQPDNVQKILRDNEWAHPEAHANQPGEQIYREIMKEMSRKAYADGLDLNDRQRAANNGNIVWTPESEAEARAIEDRMNNPDRAASEALRAAGIPGLRYLDGGSRSAGDGTHNYVIFDDSRIDVLSKEQTGAPMSPAATVTKGMAPGRAYKMLRGHLDKMGLQDVALNFNPWYEHQGRIDSDAFGEAVITIGNTLRPKWTVGHEAVHAFRWLGLFTDAEWSTLSAEAKATWMERYDIANRYPDLTADEQIEEAVAEAFGEAFDKKNSTFKMSGKIRDLLAKIGRLIRAVQNWAKGMGLRTPEDVFDAMARGDFKKRRDVAGWTSQTGRLMKQARRPTPAQRTRNGLFLPDRSVHDALFETTGGVLAKAKALRGAGADFMDYSVRRRFQDRFLPVLRAQQIIERQLGGPLPEDMNAYLFEEMYAGRAGAKLDMIDQKYLTPIIGIIGKTKGMTVETVGQWLTARHAEERNVQIAKINPKIPDGGSGMFTAEAQAILAQVAASPQASSYDDIGTLIDDLRHWGMQERVDMGLLTVDEANAWRKTYQKYVPLKGWEEADGVDAELDITGIGRGYNVRGKESQRALGRSTEAYNPLVSAIVQAQEVAVRTEKNRVGQALYRLARDIPSKGLWEIKPIETRRVFNERTGLVEERSMSPISLMQSPNEMAVKVDGKEHRILFHDPRLARAATNVGVDQLGAVVRVLGPISRYISMMNTMLDPEFVVRNFVRDSVTASIVIQSKEKGSAIQKGMMRDLPKALMGTWRGLGGKADTVWSKHFKEFSDAGGKVSFWILETPEASRGMIKKRIAREASGWTGMTKALVTPSVDLNPVLRGIERVNLAVDNAIRLSAFVNARRQGLSVQQAASLAKNLTVNFNRRGDYGAVMNAAYTFANAAVQGTQVMFRALKSRKVQGISAGLVLLGFLLDQANAYLSDEDDDGQLIYDKIPEYKFETSLVVMNGLNAKSATTLWLPYGFNVFPYLGNRLSQAMRGKIKPAAAVGDTLLVAFNAFAPISGQDLMGMITPTVLDPALELSRNKNWTGTPIYPDYPNMTGPMSTRYYPSATEASKVIADKLNAWTGGNYAESGYVDVTPEAIDHIAAFVFGGVGRTFGRMTDLFGKVSQGEPAPVHDIPFLRTLYTKPGEYETSQAYFDRLDIIREAHGAAGKYAARKSKVPDDVKWKADLYPLLLQAERMRKGTTKVTKDPAKAYLLLNKAFVAAWKANTPYSSQSIFE